jgi:hypothetical protein
MIPDGYHTKKEAQKKIDGGNNSSDVDQWWEQQL